MDSQYKHRASAVKSSARWPMVSVFDGRRCIGRVLDRGRLGFEAVDADQRILGSFRTQRAAADALSDITTAEWRP